MRAATWPNWNGSGTDLILVTSYRDGADAHTRNVIRNMHRVSMSFLASRA